MAASVPLLMLTGGWEGESIRGGGGGSGDRNSNYRSDA